MILTEENLRTYSLVIGITIGIIEIILKKIFKNDKHTEFLNKIYKFTRICYFIILLILFGSR
ncbi:hypothetical protein SDC9_89238 [bioreactor metagenome]|uniref:Uncharacterized protein n=1 Tax=bioreactor metagenome TaxID=1076179 RepID=A0A644ZP05_9ZZZZ